CWAVPEVSDFLIVEGGLVSFSSSGLRFCVARRKSPKHHLELLFASNELRAQFARAYLSRSPGDFAMKEKTPPPMCFLLALARCGLVLSCGDYGDLPLGGIAPPANGGEPAGGSGGSGAALPALDAPLPCEVLGSA